MYPTPEAYLPSSEQKTRIRLGGFLGLDRRGGIDGRALCAAEGIDPRAYPALATAASASDSEIRLPGKPLSLFAPGDGTLIAFTNVSGMVLVHRVRGGRVETAELTTESPSLPRRLVLFNQYSDPLDPIGGSYTKTGIILPDQRCILLDSEKLTLTKLGADEVTLPAMDCGCVHLARLFAAQGDRLYASAYNSPADFELDTAKDMGAANAWATTSQANAREGGGFTALTVYDGRVLAMRPHFTHVINNTKNPFRLADLMALGTDNEATLCEVDGYLYFTCGRYLYRYDGSSVRELAAPLAAGDLRTAAAVGFDGLYLLAPPSGGVYAYSAETDAWGALGGFAGGRAVAMAACGEECWFLMQDGRLFSVRADGIGAFSCESTPILGTCMAPRRALRLSLAVTLGVGAELHACVRAPSGETVELLAVTDRVGTQVLQSPGFTPQATAFPLLFSGRGSVRIHRVELTLAGDDEF